MNDTTRINIVVVDLAKTLLRESSCMLLATGDEYANRFGAIIVRNGEPVDITNFLVSGSFIRPDGVTLTLEGVSEGNMVYVDLPSDCYKYDGVFTLSIKIVKGDVTETVRMVDGYIRRTETGNYVADEETIITLDKIQGMANEMAQLYEQAKETMEELSGATENLENALEEAETLPEKLPYIGDNGNWMQWDDDAKQFVDTGSPSRGIPGQNGVTPVKGKDYFDGEPGYTPQKGIDYFDGEDGHSPVKGTDYWTAGDRAAIKAEALADLADVQTTGTAASVASLNTTVRELGGRTSTLETKTKYMAEDVGTLQTDFDDFVAFVYECIIKIGFRMIRLERHLGLTPPVNENIDTTLPDIDDEYDDVFPE